MKSWIRIYIKEKIQELWRLIKWSHMFFGLPDPDPLVSGMDLDPALDPDPDPSITMQK
jgi:hypothetical protein